MHKWSSLVCTVFVLVLCVTGLPLVFQDELGDWIAGAPRLADLPAGAARADVDQIIAEAMRRHPDREVMTVFLDDDEPKIVVSMAPSWQAFMQHPDQRNVVTADARTGAVLEDRRSGEAPGARALAIILGLHTDLFAGVAGGLFMAAMGLSFVAAMVSGVVLYGPFMRRLPFGTVRTDRSSRARWLDLHNLLGVVVLAWAVVVGATGIANEVSIPLFTLWQQTDVQAAIRPWQGLAAPARAEMDSPSAVLATATRALPGMQVMTLVYPGGPFGSAYHFLIWTKGNTRLTSRLFTPVLVDARTGALTGIVKMPWYLRALELSRPLHFGDYGGMPLKVIWALLDLCTIAVLGSGLVLWRRPRRVQAGSPLPRQVAGPTK